MEVVSKSLAGQLFGRHEFGGKAEAAHDDTADFKVTAGDKRKRDDDDEEAPKKKKRKKDKKDKKKKKRRKQEEAE